MSCINSRNRIRVVARFRPLTEEEQAFGAEKVVQYSTNYKSVGIKGQIFSFDRVFDHGSTQQLVYDLAAEPIVRDFLKGYNGTIITYGQSGSGKTFTMHGTGIAPGIIPRTLSSIFELSDEKCKFTVSFYEIYMEQINDLLDASKKNLKIRQPSEKTVIIENLTAMPIESQQQAMQIFKTGAAQRTKTETKLNTESSRSHAVFVINMTKDPGDGTICKSTLHLVDLAGTEKVSKSGADGVAFDEARNVNLSLASFHKVIHALTENQRGSDIFVSPSTTYAPLLADRTNMVLSPPASPSKQDRRHFYISSTHLPQSPSQYGVPSSPITFTSTPSSPPAVPRSHTTPMQVTDALCKSTVGTPTSTRTHIPYRDSKLTQVLAESLGGNTRTCLILHCSPSLLYEQETLSTLRFGQRAKLVKNEVVINRTGYDTPPRTPTSITRTNTAQLLQQLYTKVDVLQQQLLQYQKQEQVSNSSGKSSPRVDRAPGLDLSAQVARLSESVAELQAERDALRLDNERLMLLLEESEASKLTADKLSELLALRNTFIEEARQRQEEKLDELELLIEQYHAQRMKLEESVADTQSMSSIGDLTDASGAAELTHLSLLLTQNEELYRANEALQLSLAVAQQKLEEKDKYIRQLEEMIRRYESMESTDENTPSLTSLTALTVE